jgi:hypothetical protein
MREPHKKGVAHHFGSESCVWVRKDAGETLTGGTHRRGMELRNHPFGVPTVS